MKIMTFLFKAALAGKVVEGEDHRKILEAEDVQDLYADNPMYWAIQDSPVDYAKELGLCVDKNRTFFELRYGVKSHDFSIIEELFRVQLNIYMKVQSGTKKLKRKGKQVEEKIFKVSSVRLSVQVAPDIEEVPLLLLHSSDFIGQGGVKVKPTQPALNMCHFYLITDINRFAGRLTCPKCNCLVVSNAHKHFKRHVEKCQGGGVTMKYTGGFKSLPTTVIDDLKGLGIKVPPQIRYCEDFICYDYEARLETLDVPGGPSTEYSARHVPVSYCMASSVEESGYKECVDADPDRLLGQFMDDLCHLREPIVRKRYMQWHGVMQELNSKVSQAFQEYQSQKDQYDLWCEGEGEEKNDNDNDDDDDMMMMEEEGEEEELTDGSVMAQCRKLRVKWYKYYYNNLCKVKDRLVKHLQGVEILGFNAARYDLNLIRSYLFELLLDQESNDFWKGHEDTLLYPEVLALTVDQREGVNYSELEVEIYDFDKLSVIKQGNAYTSLTLGSKFKFLDLYKYQSPTTNLDNFLTTHGCAPNTKGKFCYEYLTEATLYSTECPQIEHFHSKLKGHNELGKTREEQEQTWLECVKGPWDREGCETLADFLRYYNRLDVVPLVQAVKTWLKSFHLFGPDREPDEIKGIDVLKNTLGIPSVARELLYKQTAKHPDFKGFPLFDEGHKHLFELFQDQIVGGPSIVFSFKHKAGETLIRPEEFGEDNAKVCQSILGLDACSLYGSRFLRGIPHGIPIELEVMDHNQVTDPLPDRTYFRRKVGMHLESRLEMHYLTHPDTKSQYPDLVHRFNTGRQFQVGHFRVDGISHGQKTIVEVDSCFHHGCLEFFKRKWSKEGKEPTQQEQDQVAFRRMRTDWRAEFIAHKTGYQVKQLCECDPELRRMRWAAHALGSKFSQKWNFNMAVSDEDLLNAVKQGQFQGYLLCDCHVPEELWDRFKSFPPFFLTAEVGTQDMGPESLEYIRKHKLSRKSRVQLLSVMRAEKLLLSDVLIRWYLENGLVISRVHGGVEMRKDLVCQDFMRDIIVGRREADARGDKAEAQKQKLTGNSAYGGTLLNKEGYSKHRYVPMEKSLKEHLRPNFVKSTQVSQGTIEVETSARNVKQDVPLYIGFEILQGGKLIMLDFVHSFLYRFLDPRDFQEIQMDTDSKYLSLSCPIDLEKLGNPHLSESQRCAPDLDYHPLLPIIKPEMRAEFMHMLKGHCTEGKPGFDPQGRTWLPRACCAPCRQLDSRLPETFQIEATGHEMNAASSKCYSLVTFQEDKDNPSGFKEKFSAKGVQARALKGVMEAAASSSSSSSSSSSQPTARSFGEIIEQTRAGQSFQIVNRGFRLRKDQEGPTDMVTYQQSKAPVNPLYLKRLINGNSTLPLQGKFTPYKAVVRKRKREALEAKLINTPELEPSEEPPGGSRPKKRRLRAAAGSCEEEEEAEEDWETRAYNCNDVLRDMGYADAADLLVPSDPESGDET